ncbi:hypothetical protein QVD17_11961 [Tagetes erecta]|uniref:Uncharacterized protein n=1 Tax=Tagetes erecta TaxID=13708 RepID=A0AAD8KYD6_TARER|nr:hypothetical protein QVD17_11961 [Tagetes erecta]
MKGASELVRGSEVFGCSVRFRGEASEPSEMRGSERRSRRRENDRGEQIGKTTQTKGKRWRRADRKDEAGADGQITDEEDERRRRPYEKAMIQGKTKKKNEEDEVVSNIFFY